VAAHIVAGVLAIVYGVLTLIGASQMRERLAPWSPPAMAAAALGLIVGGLLAFVRASAATWVLLISLVAVQVLAIANGYKMHGRPNWGHHVLRLAITVTLLILITR
jgi:uncharacterized membrane protein HdeD (DUF308 family)